MLEPSSRFRALVLCLYLWCLLQAPMKQGHALSADQFLTTEVRRVPTSLRLLNVSHVKCMLSAQGSCSRTVASD